MVEKDITKEDTPNDELTIMARTRQWDIFSPDWGYIAQIPVFELGSLCALSVGLHPNFADPSWALFIAIPFYKGEWDDEFCPLEDAGVGRQRAALLNDFIRRVHIAAANLAPHGALPIADGKAAGERTLIRASDFVAWAKSKGWELPTELDTAFGAVVSNPDKIDPRKETTYLQIIRVLLKELRFNGKAPHSDAAAIQACAANHKVSIPSKTQTIVNVIEDALKLSE